MHVRSRRPARRWLFSVFAVLAFTAQAVVALLPLAEQRFERTLSAHVEQTGTRGHTSHNEATCANCQARSIQGTTARPLVELPVVSRAIATQVTEAERLVSTPYHPQANPRAPPVVV
jgi:hypothetical protein